MIVLVQTHHLPLALDLLGLVAVGALGWAIPSYVRLSLRRPKEDS